MNEPTDFKRTFIATLETAAAEPSGWVGGPWERHGGEHPDVDRLLAYHRGELAADDADELQEHLATCRQCTSLVSDMAAFPHLEAQPGEPGEHEIAQAWRRVERLISRQPIAAAASAVAARAAVGAAPRMPPPSRRAPWQRTAVAWAAAACLALLCVGLGSWNLRLEGRLADLTAPRPNVPVVDLGNGGLKRSAGEAVPGVPAGDGPFTLYFYPDLAWDRYAAFEWSVSDEENATVLSGGGLEERSGTFTLGLDRGSLTPGVYQLHLRGVPKSGGDAVRLVDYDFQLDAR